MNEPEQNRPTSANERRETAGDVPVSSSSGRSSDAHQPEYGQINQPEYGAMSSQYPSGYDPYVYGAPDPEPVADENRMNANQPQGYPQNAVNGQPYANQQSGFQSTQGNQSPSGQNALYGQGNPYEWNPSGTNPYDQNPYGQNPYGQNPYGWNGNPHGQTGQQPHMRGNVNLDDPGQNPLYGRWDTYAILALVFALLLPVPVVPAVMGAMAMWRTKTFHMKGFWLGAAALVINILYTIGMLWLMVHGISTSDLYYQFLQDMMGGTAGNGSDTLSA